MTPLERKTEERLTRLELLEKERHPVIKKKRKSRQELVDELAAEIEKKEAQKQSI